MAIATPGQRPLAGVRVAAAQDGRHELARVAVEDQQRVVHVLAEGAVVGGALLLAVDRVIRPVEVEEEALRDAVAAPLRGVDGEERHGQAVAGLAVGGVLQPRHGRLAGQVGAGLRQAAADQLEQRIGPQGVGVQLVLVAAGDLEDALTHQRLQRVRDRTAPPVRDAGRQRGAEAQGGVRLREPGQPAVRGQPAPVEGRLERQPGGGEGKGPCGRIPHGGAPPFGLVSVSNSTITDGAPSLSNRARA
jgi:hypothetical protein